MIVFHKKLMPITNAVSIGFKSTLTLTITSNMSYVSFRIAYRVKSICAPSLCGIDLNPTSVSMKLPNKLAKSLRNLHQCLVTFSRSLES